MKFYKTCMARYFMIVAVVLIIMMGIVLRIVSINTVRQVKQDDTKEYLATMTKQLAYLYEMKDPSGMGFYTRNGGLMIGKTYVGAGNAVVDRMKEITGAEFSIFLGDKRISTTILDENGNRYINTYATDIWQRYAKAGYSYYGEGIEIDNVKYWGYYLPIINYQKEPIGMLFAGVPMDSIQSEIGNLGRNVTFICIGASILAFLLIIFVVTRMLKLQNIIVHYMDELDHGDFTEKMPEKILKRKDEYGNMAKVLVSLSESLEGRVQRDPLTKLYNRGAAMKKLKKYLMEANSPDGQTFSFAIGDIDFFKKVNDTYGHNCGDEVLKRVATIMETNMKNKGFVARWGGEEFVLVFRGEVSETKEYLEQILNSVRASRVVYDDYEVMVTMTFGLVQYYPPNNLDYVITKADELLYKGKEGGRNQIVFLK